MELPSAEWGPPECYRHARTFAAAAASFKPTFTTATLLFKWNLSEPTSTPKSIRSSGTPSLAATWLGGQGRVRLAGIGVGHQAWFTIWQLERCQMGPAMN